MRELNSRTKVYCTPLPNIEEYLDQLHGQQFFSKADLQSAFHQVVIDEKSKHKTAFVANNRKWQYRKMPFGSINSSYEFTRLMNLVLGDMNMKRALVFVDDVLIFSKTWKQHLDRLEELFSKLQEANLTLKPGKCNFAAKNIPFLGHVITSQGRYPNPSKVEDIKNLPAPKNRRDVKSFLGKVIYYKSYIPDLSDIAMPLTNLTQLRNKFIWGEAEEASFNTLKSKLISPPILRHPQFDREFIIHTDASLYAMGSVLSQIDEDGREYAIQYYSKKFNQAETRYTVSERELAAIIYAIKAFNPYVYGQKFTIYTDHAPLQHLRTMKFHTQKHGRWLEFLQSYNFEVKYRPGNKNANADYLSRLEKHKDPCIILDNKHAVLLPNLQVNEVQLQEWKQNICKQANISVTKEDESDVTEPVQDVYKIFSQILTNSPNHHDIIRKLTHDYILKHRKYFKDYQIPMHMTDIQYLKAIRQGTPGARIEIQALSSLLKIPIKIKDQNETVLIQQVTEVCLLLLPCHTLTI